MISIHAPARGATILADDRLMYNSDFNPRSREGSDDSDLFAVSDEIKISIHAPARGATIRAPRMVKLV